MPNDCNTRAALSDWDVLPDAALVKMPVVMVLFGGISDEEVRRRVAAGRIPKCFKATGSRQNFWRVGDLRAALARVEEAINV
jgi:hypothetical protein